MFSRIDCSGPEARLCLYGALDGTAARALQPQVADLAVRGDVVLDLSGVLTIDDAGLRGLAYLARRLSGYRRRLRLVGIAGPLLAPLRHVGLAESPDAPPPAAVVAAPRRRRASLAH